MLYLSVILNSIYILQTTDQRLTLLPFTFQHKCKSSAVFQDMMIIWENSGVNINHPLDSRKEQIHNFDESESVLSFSSAGFFSWLKFRLGSIWIKTLELKFKNNNKTLTFYCICSFGSEGSYFNCLAKADGTTLSYHKGTNICQPNTSPCGFITINVIFKDFSVFPCCAVFDRARDNFLFSS